MANDLTPAIFGLVGAIVGGVATSAGALFVERGRFKRENDIERERERRRFRIEALERSSAVFHSYYVLVLDVVRLRTEHGFEAELPREARAALDAALAESIQWAERVHDERLRALYNTAIDAAFECVRPTSERSFRLAAHDAPSNAGRFVRATAASLRTFYD
jgi:hypothetical protein